MGGGGRDEASSLPQLPDHSFDVKHRGTALKFIRLDRLFYSLQELYKATGYARDIVIRRYSKEQKIMNKAIYLLHFIKLNPFKKVAIYMYVCMHAHMCV